MKLGKNNVSNNEYAVEQFKMHFKVCSNEIYLGLVAKPNIVLYIISARSNPCNLIARSNYVIWISSLVFSAIFYLCGNPLHAGRLKSRDFCCLDEFWLRYRGSFSVAVKCCELAMVLDVRYK